MKIRDLNFFNNMTMPQKIVFGLILFVIFMLYFDKNTEEYVDPKPIITEEMFDEFPLLMWKDTQKKWNGEQGDVVKIKYRVSKRDTKIWIYDENGKVVHEQPFARNPWDGGMPRDFTYSWPLYDTEDYGDYIPPGEYKVTVCTKYKRNVELTKWITI